MQCSPLEMVMELLTHPTRKRKAPLTHSLTHSLTSLFTVVSISIYLCRVPRLPLGNQTGPPRVHTSPFGLTGCLPPPPPPPPSASDLFIICKYTVAVVGHTRRGHQISLWVVVNHPPCGCWDLNSGSSEEQSGL